MIIIIHDNYNTVIVIVMNNDVKQNHTSKNFH